MAVEASFAAVPTPHAGEWQRAVAALQDQVGAIDRREFFIFTHLGDSPEQGRDISSFRRTETTTFESWYPAGCAGGSEKATSFVTTADTLYAAPHIFTAAYRIRDLSVEVTTGAGNARVGVYESRDDLNGNPYPSRRLYESASTDVSSTGVKTLTGIDLDVAPGRLYWFTVVTSGTPGLRAVARSVVPPVLGWPAALGPDPAFGYSVAWPYAALPIQYPDGGASFSSGGLPAVFMRLHAGNLREEVRSVPAWAPPRVGYVLRRAKFIYPRGLNDEDKASFLTVQACIREGERVEVLGSFNTRELHAAPVGSAFPVTGVADIDREIRSGQTLEVRLIQSGWPRVPVADSVVQWDLFYRGGA